MKDLWRAVLVRVSREPAMVAGVLAAAADLALEGASWRQIAALVVARIVRSQVSPAREVK